MSEAEIKWPKGRTTAAFTRKLQKLRNVVATGRLLAIDPASGAESMPGYALYECGVLKEAGVIDIPSKETTGERLAQLMTCFREQFDEVDILAIEHLRGGKVSNTTHWSTGMAVAGVKHKHRIEVPIAFWKSIAKVRKDYIKSDDADAILIGEVVVRLSGVLI